MDYRCFDYTPNRLHPIGLPMTFGLLPDYKYVWTIPIGLREAVKKLSFLGIIPELVDPPPQALLGIKF